MKRNQLLYLDVMKTACHCAPGCQSTRKHAAAPGAFKPLNPDGKAKAVSVGQSTVQDSRDKQKRGHSRASPASSSPLESIQKPPGVPLRASPGLRQPRRRPPRDREGLCPHHSAPAGYSRRGETAGRRGAAPCAQARAREAAAQPARPLATRAVQSAQCRSAGGAPPVTSGPPLPLLPR